ncbi:UNVERIFIED_CONTAM: hypothetical protein Sradi_3599400 [Sesamum radiatum]|uniref:Uncharacterized protein n=1 Tax=Sesamum radiatum TaxID=300843 RepID=A0AAW2QH05_SESRA
MQQRKGKEAKVIDEAKKKLRENAVPKFCKWMYDAGLPFNAVNYESLGPAIEAIGQYGSRTKFIGSVDASSYSHTGDIDESNEWLFERLNPSKEDDDEENAHVYKDDDLTWGDVGRASRVDEDAYAFRPRHSKELKYTKVSSSKATKRASTFSKSTIKRLYLIDDDKEEEEEEEINFDDTDEEDFDCYKSNSD